MSAELVSININIDHKNLNNVTHVCNLHGIDKKKTKKKNNTIKSDQHHWIGLLVFCEYGKKWTKKTNSNAP